MEDKLLKIISFYGVLPQLKYFQSEVFELNEAIITHEFASDDNKTLEYFGEITKWDLSKIKQHIAEEIADVMVMLYQFPHYYYEKYENKYDVNSYKFKTDNYEHVEDILKYLKNFQKEEICHLTCTIAILEEREQEYINDYQYEDILEAIDNVFYKLKSIQLYYEITDEQVNEIMNYKINRQINRIEKENK